VQASGRYSTHNRADDQVSGAYADRATPDLAKDGRATSSQRQAQFGGYVITTFQMQNHAFNLLHKCWREFEQVAHDPEKWVPVFPRNNHGTRCAEIMLKQKRCDHDLIQLNQIMI